MNRPLNQKIFTEVKNELTHNRDRGRSGAAGFTSFLKDIRKRKPGL